LIPTSHSFSSDVSGNARENPANYWLDEEEEEEEDYVSWRPTAHYSMQRYSQYNAENIHSSGNFLKQMYYSKSRIISNNPKYVSTAPTGIKEIPKFNRRSTLSTSSIDMTSLLDSLSEKVSTEYLPGQGDVELRRQRSLSLVQEDRLHNDSVDQMDRLDSTKLTFGANVYIHHSLSIDPVSEYMAQKMNDSIDKWANLGQACFMFGNYAQNMHRFELAKIWKLLSYILDNGHEKRDNVGKKIRYVDEAQYSNNNYVCSVVFKEM
jgi:hypothetical protein